MTPAANEIVAQIIAEALDGLVPPWAAKDYQVDEHGKLMICWSIPWVTTCGEFSMANPDLVSAIREWAIEMLKERESLAVDIRSGRNNLCFDD